jgi:hypothetical protein
MPEDSTWTVQPYYVPQSSYNQPVALPTHPPDQPPYLCAPINVDYMRYVVGCLRQLQEPVAWEWATTAELNDIMHWWDTFIGNVAGAAMCDQRGSVSITILAGNASASVTVTFPYAFTAAPIVVCSCDNPTLIASPSAITATDFSATITADVPQLVNVTANLLWIAGPAT